MRIDMFKLVCITNRKLCKPSFLDIVKMILSKEKSNDTKALSTDNLTDTNNLSAGKSADSNLPKPDMLILREKDLSEEEYYELAKKIKPMCEEAGVEFVIHTHVNVAKELGVKSIHLPLGKYIMLTEEDKQNFNNIGTSVHSLEDLEKAISLGATYVLAGHIYETDCKKGLPGRGLEFLQQICNNASVPVIAIGGMNADRLKEVEAVGASGAAIMSGYMKK